MSEFLDRIAGAPITWGVDPSPGWGYMMDRDRVLDEMRAVGLSATELGPDGWLPTDPAELTGFMAAHGLTIVGGFVPALLYRRERIATELEYVSRAAAQLQAAGSKVLVLGPSSHRDGYDVSVDMTDGQWAVFLESLQRLRDIAGEKGLVTALHQHWGMAIERRHQVDRLLESSDVGLCLDTGHYFLAGIDPAEIAAIAPSRIEHVHLKDMSATQAERVRSGEAPFRQNVIDGMFVPLGAGDVDIEGVIRGLEMSGYQGWYVLEQDTSLEAEPAAAEGPQADAAASVEYLRNLAHRL